MTALQEVAWARKKSFMNAKAPLYVQLSQI
jgi:hypothetical protein